MDTQTTKLEKLSPNYSKNKEASQSNQEQNNSKSTYNNTQNTQRIKKKQMNNLK